MYRSKALDTALAIHSIEGWVPNDHEENILTAVAWDQIPIAYAIERQLRIYRTAKTTAYRRSLFSRADPYYLAGKNTLQNNFSLTCPQALQRVEMFISAARSIELYKDFCTHRQKNDIRDMTNIHAYIFHDIYPWAGKYRTVNIQKYDTSFASIQYIPELVTAAQEYLALFFTAPTPTEKVRYLAAAYSIYNYAHPFREGNGRTGLLWLELNCNSAGDHLDLHSLTTDEWYLASQASSPKHRNDAPNPEPIFALLYPRFHTSVNTVDSANMRNSAHYHTGLETS